MSQTLIETLSGIAVSLFWTMLYVGLLMVAVGLTLLFIG